MSSQMNSFLTVAVVIALAAGLVGCSDHPPIFLSSEFVLDEAGASAPTAAVDDRSGRMYWSWFGRTEDGEATVYVSSMDPSEQTPSARVAAAPAGEPVNPHPQAPPQISVAPDGAVYVAWSTRIDIEGRRFPASNLRLARSTDGGKTFEPPVHVNADHDGAPAGHTFHNLAVGPDGIVYVSWLDSRASPSASGGVRDSAATGAGHDGHFTSGSHRGHSEASSTTVRVARSDDGGRSFEPALIVARGTCQCCRTALHVANDGTVYLAWRHIYAANVRDMAIAHSHDGARSFSAPVRIHADEWQIDGCPHSGPSIATDANGDIHAVWYTAAENRAGLYHAVSSEGGSSFGPPEPLVREVPISSAAVAASNSAAWLIWEDAHDGTIRLRGADESANAQFDPIKGSAPAIAAGSQTALAWERDGSIVAAFIR